MRVSGQPWWKDKAKTEAAPAKGAAPPASSTPAKTAAAATAAKTGPPAPAARGAPGTRGAARGATPPTRGGGSFDFNLNKHFFTVQFNCVF